MAPESHAGLFYLALGLFHRDRDVRIRVADLLDRIARHEAGVHWWRGLSKFEKLAFHRIRREAEAAKLNAHHQQQLDAAASAGRAIVLVHGKLDAPAWAYTEGLYEQASHDDAAAAAAGKTLDMTDEDHTDDEELIRADDPVPSRGPDGGLPPWVEMLSGSDKRPLGSRVWRVRRDLGRGAGE